jgi:hypothetical protein
VRLVARDGVRRRGRRPAISLNLDDLKVLVDLYANAKGTLQWVVLVTGEQQ